jgi:hypothetical protein
MLEERFPLIVMIGPRRAGKTALACYLAHTWAQWYPDGLLYADLGPHPVHGPARPEDVLTGWLTALGADHLPTDLTELSQAFHNATADLHLLAVIDDAMTTEQTLPLLRPGGTTLVTTREHLVPLRMHGAQFVQVGPAAGTRHG